MVCAAIGDAKNIIVRTQRAHLAATGPFVGLMVNHKPNDSFAEGARHVECPGVTGLRLIASLR